MMFDDVYYNDQQEGLYNETLRVSRNVRKYSAFVVFLHYYMNYVNNTLRIHEGAY